MSKIIAFPGSAFSLSQTTTASSPVRRTGIPPEWLLCAGALVLLGGLSAALAGALLLALSLLPGNEPMRGPGWFLTIDLLPALLLGALLLDRYDSRRR